MSFQDKRTFSNWAIGIVAGIVAIALFAAVLIITRPLGTSQTEAEAKQPTSTQETSKNSPSASPNPESSGVDNPGQSVEITSATSLDPFGDNNEHPELQHLLIDGETGPAWYSRFYNAPNFAGMKPGIGIALTLNREAAIEEVVIHSDAVGGSFELRATSADDPTGGTVLAQGSFDHVTTVKVTDTTKTSSVVLWCKELPHTSDGRNRLSISEIAIKGN
ncbi:MAG: hypothetical protein Q4G30_10215 [Actinomycetaceae bacterium]|nr:hypothetical protein [Actinomycetaceae bacterium]